ATVQTAVTNSPGLVIGIAASLPQMLSLSSIPSVQVSSAVQVNGSGSALSVGTNPSGPVVNLKVSDAFGPQTPIDVGSSALRGLDIEPTDNVSAIVSPNVAGNIYAGLAHPNSVDIFIPLAVDEGLQAISLQPYALSGLAATTGSISGSLPDADPMVSLDNEPRNSVVNGAAR